MEVAGTTVGVVVAGTTDAVGGDAAGVGLPHPAPSSHSRAVTITKPQRTQVFI